LSLSLTATSGAAGLSAVSLSARGPVGAALLFAGGLAELVPAVVVEWQAVAVPSATSAIVSELLRWLFSFY
jgi:hypothetical protein